RCLMRRFCIRCLPTRACRNARAGRAMNPAGMSRWMDGADGTRCKKLGSKVEDADFKIKQAAAVEGGPDLVRAPLPPGRGAGRRRSQPIENARDLRRCPFAAARGRDAALV